MNEVNNQDADALIETSRKQTLRDDAFGQLIRNMYARLVFLENELSEQKKKPRTRSITPNRNP